MDVGERDLGLHLAEMNDLSEAVRGALASAKFK